MTQSIIIGIDGTPRGESAAALGGTLARLANAPVLLARIVPQAFPDNAIHPTLTEWTPEEQADAGFDRDDDAVGSVSGIDHVVLLARSVAAGLQWLAEQRAAGMIVIGSADREILGRLTVGSVGERLLHGAPCPVAIAPPDFSGFSRGVFGVGFDGSEESRAALAFAAQIAERADAAIRVIAVYDTGLELHRARAAADGGVFTQRIRDDLHHDAETAAAELPSSLHASTILLDGDPASSLIEQSEGLDLLVCGSRSYGPVRTVLLGGVSHVLVRGAACPVVVVTRPAGQGAADDRPGGVTSHERGAAAQGAGGV